jgi:hypothetical protein
MRRAPLLALALCLVAAAPASAAKSSPTRTPVRLIEPSPANATVAGFELDLVKAHAKARSRKASVANASVAFAHIAAGLPKNVSVFAVVGKQKRSDRVKGVMVAVNRARAVAAGATPAARKRRLTINLKHARIPKGFRLALKLKQSSNVLSHHRAFACGSYFKTSDLAGVQRLGGPALRGITMGTLVQAACASAKKNPAPFPTLGEFRTALNAPSGALPFTVSTQFPNVVNGIASFNYGVRAFAVLADKGHQFTNCGFAFGTCAISTSASPNDYALFTLNAPAPANVQLPIALATAPNPAPALPFQFFGFDSGNHRQGPLLTSGP